MFDDIEHDGDVDGPYLFQDRARKPAGPNIEPPLSCELRCLVCDLDTVNLVMIFGFEQEKPVCGPDFDQGARRNYLPNAINRYLRNSPLSTGSLLT